MGKIAFYSLLAATVVQAPNAVSLQDKEDQRQPVVSGTTRGNVGCVILEKHTPVKGKLLAVGVIYARTEYRVVQSFNYTMPKQKYTGQGEIDDLNRLATRDKIKLVVVPSHYSDEELQKARKLCQGQENPRSVTARPQSPKNLN